MRSAIYLCMIALHQCVVALELGSTPRQPGTTACQTRRGLLVGATAASLMRASVPAAMAEQTSPQVTALVTLDLSIARGPSSPLRIELFGDAAPASVEFFSRLASGTLQAKCTENIEACQEFQGVDVGYKGSQLWRLVPNKRVDFGRVDSMFASRIPPTFAVERNGDLKPSTRGAVSVKRGGERSSSLWHPHTTKPSIRRIWSLLDGLRRATWPSSTRSTVFRQERTLSQLATSHHSAQTSRGPVILLRLTRLALSSSLSRG